MPKNQRSSNTPQTNKTVPPGIKPGGSRENPLMSHQTSPPFRPGQSVTTPVSNRPSFPIAEPPGSKNNPTPPNAGIAVPPGGKDHYGHHGPTPPTQDRNYYREQVVVRRRNLESSQRDIKIRLDRYHALKKDILGKRRLLNNLETRWNRLDAIGYPVVSAYSERLNVRFPETTLLDEFIRYQIEDTYTQIYFDTYTRRLSEIDRVLIEMNNGVRDLEKILSALDRSIDIFRHKFRDRMYGLQREIQVARSQDALLDEKIINRKEKLQHLDDTFSQLTNTTRPNRPSINRTHPTGGGFNLSIFNEVMAFSLPNSMLTDVIVENNIRNALNTLSAIRGNISAKENEVSQLDRDIRTVKNNIDAVKEKLSSKRHQLETIKSTLMGEVNRFEPLKEMIKKDSHALYKEKARLSRLKEEVHCHLPEESTMHFILPAEDEINKAYEIDVKDCYTFEYFSELDALIASRQQTLDKVKNVNGKLQDKKDKIASEIKKTQAKIDARKNDLIDMNDSLTTTQQNLNGEVNDYPRNCDLILEKRKTVIDRQQTLQQLSGVGEINEMDEVINIKLPDEMDRSRVLAYPTRGSHSEESFRQLMADISDAKKVLSATKSTNAELKKVQSRLDGEIGNLDNAIIRKKKELRKQYATQTFHDILSDSLNEQQKLEKIENEVQSSDDAVTLVEVLQRYEKTSFNHKGIYTWLLQNHQSAISLDLGIGLLQQVISSPEDDKSLQLANELVYRFGAKNLAERVIPASSLLNLAFLQHFNNNNQLLNALFTNHLADIAPELSSFVASEPDKAYAVLELRPDIYQFDQCKALFMALNQNASVDNVLAPLAINGLTGNHIHYDKIQLAYYQAGVDKLLSDAMNFSQNPEKSPWNQPIFFATGIDKVIDFANKLSEKSLGLSENANAVLQKHIKNALLAKLNELQKRVVIRGKYDEAGCEKLMGTHRLNKSFLCIPTTLFYTKSSWTYGSLKRGNDISKGLQKHQQTEKDEQQSANIVGFSR